MDTKGMTPAQIDYAIFLLGVAAYKAGHPRKPPEAITDTPEDDRALWLAGYDGEREETRTLHRYVRCMALDELDA